MPGFLTHLVVLDRAAERLLEDRDARLREVGRVLQDHREAASTGAIGPDVAFFMDLHPIARVLTEIYEHLRLFKAKLKPLAEGVEEVKSGTVPDVDLMTGGILSEIGELFAACFDVLIAYGQRLAVEEADVYRALVPPLPLQGSEREASWYWFDTFHYRSTGPMARELIRLAGDDDELRAYAYGYLSHLAVDAVGHAFVNCVVGAPYRCLWQRHHMVDNYIDVWAARRYWDVEMLDSKVYRRYYTRPRGGGAVELPRTVADLLADATRNVFRARPHPDGRRMDGREFPGASDFQRTYRDLFNVLESSTGGPAMERPERPEGPDFDLGNLLPPPPHVPSPSDYDDPAMELLALFLWPVLLAMAAKRWVEEAIARITELAEAPPRYVLRLWLYELQMMLYHAFRAHHRALALRGYTYGYSDELRNDEERGLWSVARVEARYPHRQDDDLWQRPWRWPDSPFEADATWPGPYPVGSTPASFIEDAVLSEDVYDRLTNPRRPRDVRGVTGPLARTSGPPPPALGNATDLFVRMIRSSVEGDALPNFNLDADRGYGWPCWTWREGTRGPTGGTLDDDDLILGV